MKAAFVFNDRRFGVRPPDSILSVNLPRCQENRAAHARPRRDGEIPARASNRRFAPCPANLRAPASPVYAQLAQPSIPRRGGIPCCLSLERKLRGAASAKILVMNREKAPLNPHVPGAGRYPVCPAGREPEQADLASALERIEAEQRTIRRSSVWRGPMSGACLAAAALLAGCPYAARSPGAPGLEPIDPVVNPADEDLRNVEGLTDEILYKLLTAELAGQKGQFETALKNYMEAAVETRDVGVARRATRIALYVEDEEAIERAASLWLRLSPDTLEPLQILASAALRRNDTVQALEYLRRIVEAPGPLEQKLTVVVATLGRNHEAADAHVILDRLMGAYQADAEARLAYARVLVRLNAADRALKVLQELLDEAPGDTAIATAYLGLLHRQGDTERALAWLRERLEDSKAGDPEHRQTLRLLYARLLTDVERVREARRQFELILEQDEDNDQATYSLAMLHIDLEQTDRAEPYFRRLIPQSEYEDEATYYLGWIAERRKDYDTALKWYRAVRGTETRFHARVRIAAVQAGRGKLEQARLDLQAMRREFPRQLPQLAQSEAEILAEQELYEEALEVYERALDKGFNATLLYSRAMLAVKLDRLSLVERDLRRILVHEPDNAQALNALGYTLTDRTDRHDEAYGYIKRALLLSPNNFYILDSMGWVLYRLNELDEAEEYLRRALGIRNDAEVSAHLGEVLWSKGERKEARWVWQRALEEFPDSEPVLETIERLTGDPPGPTR